MKKTKLSHDHSMILQDASLHDHAMILHDTFKYLNSSHNFFKSYSISIMHHLDNIAYMVDKHLGPS